MLTKICNKCGRSYPADSQCPCQKQRHKIYDAYQRHSNADVYHSKYWPTLVTMCKTRCHYLDMYKLLTTGRMEPVTDGIVHHIIEINEDRSKAFDIKNLIYVSRSSHKKIHDVYNRSTIERKNLQGKLKKLLDQGV